jgi:glycine dehydrogenase subunit 2
VFMMTNPNTLGLFDPQIGQIASLLHERGALLYLDGANMNAILGAVRPGDMGADLMHYNPHKTFSGPHGGGGPGAGPIAVRADLAPYLPAPVLVKSPDGTFHLDDDRPKSIGRVRSFFGNTGVLFRAFCYIRTQGPDGLKAVSRHAVLNANYVMSLVRHAYPVPFGDRCMHEFVASARGMAKDKGVRAMDIAKRLLDFNIHAPTVYFPLIVSEALMVEPTETESRDTLEAFAKVLLAIAAEDPATLHDAPLSTPIPTRSRPRARRYCAGVLSSGTDNVSPLLLTGAVMASKVVEDDQKVYDRTVAAHGLSFAVREGKILRLVGPNGVGKAFTLRPVAGILTTTRGRLSGPHGGP